MKERTLDDIVRRIRDLPSLPVIVMELLTTIDQDDGSTQLLANKISQDQALAAKTLRLANSSFYGMPSRVTTVQQAIAILGFSTVRALVTAASVTGSFRSDASSSFNFEQFWRHAIATALCAKNLAPLLRVSADSAFIAALLHDIGQLVIATQFPDDCAAMLLHRAAEDCSTLQAERAVTGIDHASVGAAMAAHWRFPPAMVDAVAQHHAVLDSTQDSLALVVHLADGLAHALDITGHPDEATPPIDDAAWARLALDQTALEQILRNIKLEYDSVCQVLLR